MLSLKTPSKINLFLRVKGKLPNGYHEIKTVFLPLHDIFDKISIDFDYRPGIHLSSNADSLPLDSTNLCHKAADAFAKEAKITPTWQINIEKNIPVAAGMGGGSADAAAVLLLLQKQYKNPLSKSQLSELALRLGADVPYFLNPVPALGTGIGEKLKPVPLASGLYVVILAPQFPVSSAWAYKHCTPIKTKPSLNDLQECMESGEWQKLGELLYNDLATALYKKFPALAIFKQDLVEAGAINAEITGSGPTLYAIIDDEAQAKQIVAQINKKYDNSLFCTYSKIV